MIWVLHELYDGQSGEVRGKWRSNRNIPITSGVGHGVCPKSPFVFRSAAVSYERLEARCSLERTWLRDGEPTLLDLRFARGILLFRKSYAETISFLHDLAILLSQVGLILPGDSCLLGKGLLVWNMTLVKNSSVVNWRHEAPNSIMLKWNIICSRHPKHFSQTVGSCKTTKYRSRQGGDTSTRWWLPCHALQLDIGPCIKTISWKWTCLTRKYADKLLDFHREQIRVQNGMKFYVLGINRQNISQHWPVLNLGRIVLAHSVGNSKNCHNR